MKANCRITRVPNGMLTYKYNHTVGIGFASSLLSEVGEPYQNDMKAIIAEKGWTVETRELDKKPWMADFAF